MSATAVPASEAEPLPPTGNAFAAREAANISATPAAMRHYLSVPFAAVFASITLFDGTAFWPIAILVAQITLAFLCDRHIRAHESMEARRWAIRYALLSAAAGASWGAVVVLWFVAAPPVAEALFVLACIGMSAMEFIARCRFPYGYAAHAAFSLGPLVVLLLSQAMPYSFALAAVCICASGSLILFGDTIANLIAESGRLRHDNARLIAKLSNETREALQARDAAEASARAKSIFIANISHEIRTPLNAMLGMSQLLDRADLEKPNRDYVKVMLEAGRGLRTLLDDVITLARDDAEMNGKNDSDPGLAVRAVAQLLQPHAWEKRLRLSVNVPSILPRVAADSRRVRQVLLKLVENALKFTDYGGVEITVSAQERDDGRAAVYFSVSDTGLGIPSNVAETLFAPFSPGDTSYARRHQGAGLGLAVAKRVVESLGGNIGFESEPGEGTTFWFTLPVAEAVPSGAIADSDTDAEVAPPSGLSLLIHTGKLKTDLALSRILEPFGNRVIFADSRIDAAARAARETFDMILSGADDIDMLAAIPGMRTPLLAVLFANERAPVSGEQILHWPAAPQALYAAIRGALARQKQIEGHDCDNQEAAAIDASAFAALEKSLGLSTLLEILQSYIKTTENLCESLAEASAAGNWDEAGRLAQDIAGAAGGLGLAALTATARGFAQNVRNQEIEDAHALRNQAQLIVGEHARTRLALAGLYPDLAA